MLQHYELETLILCSDSTVWYFDRHVQWHPSANMANEAYLFLWQFLSRILHMYYLAFYFLSYFLLDSTISKEIF